MNSMVVLLLVAVGLSLTDALMDVKEYGEALAGRTQWVHERCTVITGASEEDVENLKKGIIPEDETVERYLLCMWILTGPMKPSLELDYQELDYLMPASMVETGRDMYANCLKQAKESGPMEPYKIIGRMVKCYHKKDPEHYITF